MIIGDTVEPAKLTVTGDGTLVTTSTGNVDVHAKGTLVCDLDATISAGIFTLNGGTTTATDAELQVKGDGFDVQVESVATGEALITGLVNLGTVGVFGTVRLEVGPHASATNVFSTASMDVTGAIVVDAATAAATLEVDLDGSGSDAFALVSSVDLNGTATNAATMDVNGSSLHAEVSSKLSINQGGELFVDDSDLALGELDFNQNFGDASFSTTVEAGVIRIQRERVQPTTSTGLFRTADTGLLTGGLARHDDFRSAVIGSSAVSWLSSSTWEQFNGRTGDWDSTSSTPGSGDRVTILNGDKVFLDFNLDGMRLLTIESGGEVIVKAGATDVTLTIERGGFASEGKITLEDTGGVGRPILLLDGAVLEGDLVSKGGKIRGTGAIYGPTSTLTAAGGKLELDSNFIHQGQIKATAGGSVIVNATVLAGSTGDWDATGTLLTPASLDFQVANIIDGEIVLGDYGSLKLSADLTTYGALRMSGSGALDANGYSFVAFGEHLP